MRTFEEIAKSIQEIRTSYWGGNRPHLVSISGGTASIVSAFIAEIAGLNYEMAFADTLIEDSDLYRFVDEAEKKLGKPIHRLQDGRTPWGVFEDEKAIGDSQFAPCSKILKTRQIRAFVKERYAGDWPVLVLGMDLSEMDRIERAEKKWEAVAQVWSLLVSFKINRPDFETILRHYDIALPSLYQYGFPHNNCGGFCVRAGQTQFLTLLKAFPERYEFHEKEQERVAAYLAKHREGTKPNFIQVQRKGVKEFLSMREFREHVEAGSITVEPFEYRGCGCFTEE